MIFKIFKFWAPFVLLTLIAGSVAYSQKQISLGKAFELSRMNNLKLRSDAMLVRYQNALVNTANLMSPTQLLLEGGQFNSTFFDTGFGISQAFNMPQVYQRRKEVNHQMVRTSEYYHKLSETEIRKQLELVFMEFSYLKAKEKIILFQDSLYSSFLEKATLRWRNGDTDILEKATASQQKMNVVMQLATIQKMQEMIVLELGLLINDDSGYVPLLEDFKILPYNIFYDSISVLKHPALRLALQEVETAGSIINSEKTALLPGFNVGYRNVSIRGTGADNLVYKGSDRFSSFQIGISIPIFRQGTNALIQAARVMQDVKRTAFESKKAEISNEIQQKYLWYTQSMAQVRQYETNALPNAALIRNLSEKQFASGQINYLEYVMLLNQTIAIESEYLELVKNTNKHIIDLFYLTSNY